MNKILENKIDTYNNNNNYQVNAINHKDSSSNESANEIEQKQNEINTKDNKEISEFKKEILEDHFINLNGKEYIKDGDNEITLEKLSRITIFQILQKNMQKRNKMK